VAACSYNSAKAAVPAAAQMVSATTNISYPLWEWFLLGGLIAIFIFSIVNWRKL
jgi:hypothetical protein